MIVNARAPIFHGSTRAGNPQFSAFISFQLRHMLGQGTGTRAHTHRHTHTHTALDHAARGAHRAHNLMRPWRTCSDGMKRLLETGQKYEVVLECQLGTAMVRDRDCTRAD